MRDNFYVVLPSNSSISYFPDNTTTHFITRLPQQLRLQGEWGVSLTDIQIPMTFLHLPEDEKTIVRRNYIIEPQMLDTLRGVEEKLNIFVEHHIVPRGFYQTIDDFIKTVNGTLLSEHLIFTLDRTGYITAQRSCKHCREYKHTIQLSPTLTQIFGYDLDMKKRGYHILYDEKLGSI